MREVCFLLVSDRILRAYLGTPARIPDSRERWEAIWNARDEITEIVHSHPGGFLGFSKEDLTTMEAVEAGTGQFYRWSIVTEDGYLTRYRGEDSNPVESPWWLALIRRLSFENQSKF